MRREGRARGAGKDSGAQRRRARSMDAAQHEKSKQKTEYGYKRRCGGKDGRGVQEKTAAARAKSEAVGRQALAERAASEAKFVLIAERKTQEEA